MASKLIALSITATLLMGSGCSKNRGWLSRNDYAEMQDPFMEPSEAVAKSSGKSKESVGRANLDRAEAPPADSRGRAAFVGSTGPKPIRPAGASGDAARQGGRLTAAAYPTEPESGASESDAPTVKSYSGPALSDFLQQRRAENREASRSVATEVDQLPARTASAARSSLNPAATRAALPTMSPEAADFSSFLTSNADAVVETTQRANQEVQKAPAGVNDFSAWAEQQKAEWSTSAESTRASVAGVPAQTRETAQSLIQKAKITRQEIADSIPTPDFDVHGEEKATPLLQQKFTQPEMTAPALSRAKAPAANDFAAASTSFEDTFKNSASGSSPASNSTASTSKQPAAKTAGSGNSRTSLDDGFRIDTGWKPAHMTRP